MSNSTPINTHTDPSTKLRVAAVTGGHSFDTIEFHQLFRELPAINAYVQHIEDWGYASPEVRASYDVIVFYTMMMDGPADEGLPWYAGKRLSALSELGRVGQGIVVLHHAILAFPEWQPWNEMVGIQNRKFGYHWEGDPTTEIADAAHPITRDLPSATWSLKDETYTMDEPTGPDVHLLLTTKHHKSMKANAWTNRYKGSKVFCYQSGHGAPVYADANFRTILDRGIRWTVGQA
jgi:type 1 glutamine amidotransferase